MACAVIDLEMGIGGTILRFYPIQRGELSSNVTSDRVRVRVCRLVCSDKVSLDCSEANEKSRWELAGT